MATTPRIPLASLPTPLHRLERLSDDLGVELWIKRDDLTGFAMGGNKVRKAEFLLADALGQGADTVVTTGAVQSNHARVIAAGAKRLGLACHLVLSGSEPEHPEGNLLLDALADARIDYVAHPDQRDEMLREVDTRLRAEGRRPYLIPLGGSNAVGAQGYVEGFQELADQLRALPPKPTWLVTAASSGGTYAGILVGRGLSKLHVEILGICVDRDPGLEDVVCKIANELADRVDLPERFTTDMVRLHPEFAGEGYGIPTTESLAAVRRVWQREGILLDQVYTAKAMAGVLIGARQGFFDGARVIFLHTGGAPALFTRDMESHLNPFSRKDFHDRER